MIGSDNGFSPVLHLTIVWTNAGLLSVRPYGTKFNENLIRIRTFSLKKMSLKKLSTKWQPFCLSLNVLTLDVADNFVRFCLFLISTVPTDGLAPLGARTSGDSVMFKFGCCIYLRLTPEGLKINCLINMDFVLKPNLWNMVAEIWSPSGTQI